MEAATAQMPQRGKQPRDRIGQRAGGCHQKQDGCPDQGKEEGANGHGETGGAQSGGHCIQRGYAYPPSLCLMRL